MVLIQIHGASCIGKGAELSQNEAELSRDNPAHGV